jgi:acyl-CoA thioester hydrolase
MPQPVVLPSYQDTVRAEWVDYNGHLRDAFYMLIFSFATDVLIDLIGLPDAVRTARRRSIYTLEAHLNYLHEIKEGAQVRVDMRVLGHDAKRLHLYLEMFSGNHGEPVAAVAFDHDVAARVREFADAHAALPPARFAGRVIGLRAAT